MQCKSLWIKASAKCINVNVLYTLFLVLSLVGFWKCKLFLQLAVLNERISMMTGHLLCVNDIN